MFFFRLFFKLNAYAKTLARESDGKCDRAYHAFISAITSDSKEN
jgi:hypothetical protein